MQVSLVNSRFILRSIYSINSKKVYSHSYLDDLTLSSFLVENVFIKVNRLVYRLKF